MVHFSIFLLLARVLPPLFLSFYHILFVITSSLSRWFRSSLFVSHTESRGGGRCGGGRVRMVVAMVGG